MERFELQTKGLFNSLAENKTPKGRAYAMTNASVDQGIVQVANRYGLIGQRPGYSASDVCYGFGYGKFACNETQSLTITGSPAGGTLTIRHPLMGTTDSAAIAYNAYPSDVAAAVASLWTAFDDGELVFSGGPWPIEPIYATFSGRYADAAQSLITLHTNSLSGGSTPSLTIAHYVNGGTVEAYFVVIQPSGTGTCTLYEVTSSDGFLTTTWTSVATGLNASDWAFAQMEDKVYATNATDGMAWFQIGGAWSGTAGIPNIQNPAAGPQSLAPYYDQSGGTLPLSPFLWNVSGGDATFTDDGTWGTSPTFAISTDKKSLDIKLNAALTSQRVSFTATLHGNTDLSHQDYLNLVFNNNPTFTTIDPATILFEEVYSDGTTLIDPQFSDGGNKIENAAGTSAQYSRRFMFGSNQRGLRTQVLKLKITFTIPTGTSTNHFQLMIYPLDTWMLDQMATLDIAAGPASGLIEYACTNVKASTGAESKLSPVGKFNFPSVASGITSHVQVGFVGSAQLTSSDFVNFYRRDRFGLWRFIGQAANAYPSQSLFVDKNMLDELDGYRTFGVLHLPDGLNATNLAVWKSCLIAMADRKDWISYVGIPTLYAPDPEQFAAQNLFDTTDPNIPRTVYMSANRSEAAVAAIGQDSLYLFGPNTSYAMVDQDGTPDGLSPPKPLPGSRGCVGARAAFPISGGAAAIASDALWYYAVSSTFAIGNIAGSIDREELSKEVRSTWNTVFGTLPAGACLVMFNDEVFAFNGSQCVKFTRNHEIEYHSFKDSFKAFVATPGNGLIGATSDGRLMAFRGQTTDAGQTVAFSYATGKMDGPRSRFLKLQVQYQGAPSIKLEGWDGQGGYAFQQFDLEPALVQPVVMHYPAETLIQGYRIRVTISGVTGDVVEDLVLFFDDAGTGPGN